MTNCEGTIKREKMLANFSSMIKPARLITNLSRQELAEKSGLPLELIAGVEHGIHRFHEAHYLPLAAVFDSIADTEDCSMYRAVLRVLTPEDESLRMNDDGGFILVKRWFDTFMQSDDSTDDDFLSDLAGNYEIYADTSAVEDENFPALVIRLEPLLRQNNTKIFVPSAAVDELEEDIEISGNAEENIDLNAALHYVRTKNEEGLIDIFECPEDFDDTEEIFTAILAGQPERIAIITQDSALAENLASKYPKVIVAHISDTGDLILWRR